MARGSSLRELRLIERYHMLPPGSTVLCAVSGGADSIYLLDRLYRLRVSSLFDFTLVAAHYNHHLRGEESDRDEAFVRRFAEDIASRIPGAHRQDKEPVPAPPVRLIVGHGDVAAEAGRRKQGIEETARQMRYDFLYRTAAEIGADRIVTAHTADDNLETLLLNLVRGAGLQGLAAIPPRQGILVRPLLSTTRRDIEEHLRLFSLPHVEDSTNADERYSRNRMRRRVLPLLEGFNPALRENSIDAIRYLRADNDYLNTQAAQISARAVQSPEGLSIPAALIARAPDPLAVRAVRQLLAMTDGGSSGCTAAHLEGLVALCRGNDPSGELHLPHGVTARRVYETLLLTTLPAPAALASGTLKEGVNPIPGTDWTVVLTGPPWPGLMVRSRREGDRLTLPGGRGRSLKKLLIDRKVPRLERDRIPVVADGDGVLAVAGLGPNTQHPRHGRIIITSGEDNEYAKE